jgi:hypothetical protein
MLFVENVRKYSYVMVFLVALLLSCNYESGLPNEIPENLEITYIDKTKGGKSFQRINIKNDDVIIEYDKNEKSPNNLSVKLTKEQKKRLYGEFVKKKFDLINSEQPAKPANENYKEISLVTDNIKKTVRSGESFPLSQEDRGKFGSLWSDMIEFEALCCPKNK